MIYVRNLKENLKLFEALASPVRLQIIEMLHDGKEMNLNEMAKKLNLTNSAMTMHIQKLSACGLIRVSLASIARGTQKLCSLTEDKLLIELVDTLNDRAFHETELNVGHYSDYSVNPTCGLGNLHGLIGSFDDTQVFAYPERFNANIVWYTDGYLTYRFPNKLLVSQKAKELQFSFEIAGEAPGGVENFPSDIYFSVNGSRIAKYDCPGEIMGRRGRFTPDWWGDNFGQYGRLKLLSITEEGTFLDGIRVGNTIISDIDLKQGKDISFTIDCSKPSENNGGVTIFGTKFGDYDQGIKCRIFY